MSTISSQKVVSGLGWVALIAYSNRALGFLTTLILAKVLAPADFGAVAVASMLTEVLRVVKDMGFSEALIYQKRSDQVAIDTANTLLIGLNVVLFLVAAALAPAMARFYENPILTPAIIVMSSNLVWDAARAVPRALTRKNADFRRLVIPEVVPVTISSALSIWMALTGFGVWSLVAKTVVHSVLGMVLLRSLPEHKPGFRFDLVAARELMQYGKFIVGTTLLLVVLYNIDRFFVSRVAGIAALGLFELAMRFVEMPVKEFSFIIGGVMFPLFVKMDRTDGSLGLGLLKTLKYTAFVSVPMAVAIAVYGPALIHALYGERWLGMIVPMQILSGYAMFRSLSSIIYDGFKAAGQPNVMLRFVVFKLLAIGLLGVPALHWYGLVGICVLILATYVLVFLWEMYTAAQLFHLELLPSLEALATPMVLPAVVIPGIYLGATTWLGPASAWQLALLAVVTGALYVLGVCVLDRQLVQDVKLLVRSRKQQTEPRH